MFSFYRLFWSIRLNQKRTHSNWKHLPLHLIMTSPQSTGCSHSNAGKKIYDGATLHSRVFYRKPSYSDCIRQNGSLIVVHRVELSLFFSQVFETQCHSRSRYRRARWLKKEENVERTSCTVDSWRKKKRENGKRVKWEIFAWRVRRAFDFERRNQSFSKAR